MNTLTLCVLLSVCSVALAFTPAQWAAAYNTPTTTEWAQWPLQSAVLTTPPEQIWPVFRQFGCSVQLLYPTLPWAIVDGPYAGYTNANNHGICNTPPITTDVGVTYNISYPGSEYLLKVTKVDDYEMVRCFQLQGPGAAAGLYVTQYISCSRLRPIVTTLNGVAIRYTLYEIGATFGLPPVGTIPDPTVSSVEQTNFLNFIYSYETSNLNTFYGNGLTNPATCGSSNPAPTPAPTPAPVACSARVTVAPRQGSQWTSNGVTNTLYDFTVVNTGSKAITAISALLNLASGSTVTQEWNWSPSTGAFSGFGGSIAAGNQDTNAGFVVAGNAVPTVQTPHITCAP